MEITPELKNLVSDLYSERQQFESTYSQRELDLNKTQKQYDEIQEQMNFLERGLGRWSKLIPFASDKKRLNQSGELDALIKGYETEQKENLEKIGELNGQITITVEGYLTDNDPTYQTLAETYAKIKADKDVVDGITNYIESTQTKKQRAIIAEVADLVTHWVPGANKAVAGISFGLNKTYDNSLEQIQQYADKFNKTIKNHNPKAVIELKARVDDSIDMITDAIGIPFIDVGSIYTLYQHYVASGELGEAEEIVQKVKPIIDEKFEKAQKATLEYRDTVLEELKKAFLG